MEQDIFIFCRDYLSGEWHKFDELYIQACENMDKSAALVAADNRHTILQLLNDLDIREKIEGEKT